MNSCTMVDCAYQSIEQKHRFDIVVGKAVILDRTNPLTNLPAVVVSFSCKLSQYGCRAKDKHSPGDAFSDVAGVINRLLSLTSQKC